MTAGGDLKLLGGGEVACAIMAHLVQMNVSTVETAIFKKIIFINEELMNIRMWFVKILVQLDVFIEFLTSEYFSGCVIISFDACGEMYIQVV